MMIKKVKASFNTYTVELSWGQLNAIYRAMEKDHADVLSDETFAEIGWFLQNVAGPGEDEDEYKEAKEAEKQAAEGGAEPGAGRNADLVGEEVPEGGDEMEGAAPPAQAAGKPMPGEDEVPEAPEGPEASEADQLLERPPTK